MRRLCLLLLTALPAWAGANGALEIAPLSATHPQTRAVYRFPQFRGREPAAGAINTWLQAVELQVLADHAGTSVFAAVWPKPGQATGLVALDYQPGEINARQVTVTLRGTRMTNEAEAFERAYSFDATSGAPIALRELFTPAGLQHLRMLVATKRSAVVRDYLRQLPANQDPDADDKQALYEDCLPSIRADGLDENEFQLTASALSLSRAGCADRERRALDELGRLPVSLPLAELAADWSPYGRCLAGLPPTAPPCTKPRDAGLDAGVYRGTIGKAAATFIVGRRLGRRAATVGYFIDRDARWIELSGEQRPDSAFWFHDLAGEQSGRLGARFVLQVDASGRLDGNWSGPDGKALPVRLLPVGATPAK